MTGKIFIKPAIDGAIVRQIDRDMRPLPPDGDWVADTLHWRRMIRNGDVVEAKPPKPPASNERQPGAPSAA
jgi:hypothetical protein